MVQDSAILTMADQ